MRRAGGVSPLSPTTDEAASPGGPEVSWSVRRIHHWRGVRPGRPRAGGAAGAAPDGRDARTLAGRRPAPGRGLFPPAPRTGVAGGVGGPADPGRVLFATGAGRVRHHR